MNWGEIKSAVRNYLEGDETTFTGHFTLFARLAEEDIYRQVQLQFTKQLAVTNLIVDDNQLSVPTDSLSIYSLSYTNPATGENHLLFPKDFAFIREAYPNPTTAGPPRFYAYRDEQMLLLAPTPDDDYNVEMHYYRKPISIGDGDNDSNENWLSKFGENALIFGIVYHGYIYLKGDQDVVQLYKGQFDKAIADFKVISEGRQRKDTYRDIDARVPT